MNQSEPLMLLTDEHRDGTIYVDGEGDLWSPSPFGGWFCTRWLPFGIVAQPQEPQVHYGPYVPVMPPKDRT
jgi:hypothetical protein